MSIKNHVIAILFLVAQTGLLAQKDTTYQTIYQETGDYQPPVIETPADRLFKTKVPARLMFKMNLAKSLFSREIIGVGVLSEGRPIEFGAEYKLSPAFSIGAYASVTPGFQITSIFSESRRPKFSSASMEVRWYHDMKKRIRSGRSANNFGGKYFGLETTALLNSLYAGNTWSTQQVALRYGLQQRFMRNGYFDISLGAGISGNSYIFRDQISFSIDQRVSAGLAAFLPRAQSTTANDGLCDVLHCQDEQYKMLKVNLFNTLVFQSNNRFSNFGLRPQIAYEHKIGKSPFSIEAEAGASYDKFKYSYSTYTDPDYITARFGTSRWTAAAELRYYYTMRKRILNGSSGNNLSGAFLALQGHRSQFIKNASSVEVESGSNIFSQFVASGDYWTANLIWGYQQRMFNTGYIQFKFGLGSTLGGYNYLYNNDNQSFTKVRRNNELNILGEFRVGFAF